MSPVTSALTLTADLAKLPSSVVNVALKKPLAGPNDKN